MSSVDVSSSAASASLLARARGVVRQALGRSPVPIVLIDGPSGAGKSTFADAVVQAWPDAPPLLVRMDDLYPGWCGLDAGSEHLHDELLAPLRAVGRGRWRRWDWTGSRPGQWHAVAAGHPLIVEGCGCLTRDTAPLADLRVWLTAEDDLRKRRALNRDTGDFDAHWDSWQRQWQGLVARQAPQLLADVVIDTTAEG